MLGWVFWLWRMCRDGDEEHWERCVILVGGAVGRTCGAEGHVSGVFRAGESDRIVMFFRGLGLRVGLQLIAS